MSNATEKEPTTALAKPTDPRVAEARAVREITVAIRGTQWGNDCTPAIQHAVARYCIRNGLDAVRHVEVLGGRIYLTGEFYEEKGAPLVLAGAVVVDEPAFVQHDQRLQALADSPIAEQADWAKHEIFRRMQARIAFGIPDDVTGACVYRGHIDTPNGRTTLVGFNWCGGATKVKKKRDGSTYRGDPVGDAEPVKTAQSRAKRRMWRQIVVALPELEARVGSIEANVRLANAELAEVTGIETAQANAFPKHPAQLANPGDTPYGEAAGTTPAASPEQGRTPEEEEFERGLDRD